MEKIGRFANKAYLKQRRRDLRQNQTKAETKLWYAIKNKGLGYKFRRQYSISRCIVDFYCHELKLIIEIDGSTHTDEKWLNYDNRRQKFLESHGFKVVRYTDEQVKHNLDGVLTHLLITINNIKSH